MDNYTLPVLDYLIFYFLNAKHPFLQNKILITFAKYSSEIYSLGTSAKSKTLNIFKHQIFASKVNE